MASLSSQAYCLNLNRNVSKGSLQIKSENGLFQSSSIKHFVPSALRKVKNNEQLFETPLFVPRAITKHDAELLELQQAIQIIWKYLDDVLVEDKVNL